MATKDAITCDKNNPQVLILGEEIDLYELGYVEKIVNIKENKTFKRDKLIVNTITQIVKNFDNFFSVDNPASIFQNIRWRFDAFKIKDQDGETIWDGIIYDISRDHKTKKAIIKSVDRLYKFQKKKISYLSDAFETAAAAFKNLCDQEGFTDYNPKAVQDSINQLTDQECLIKCYFGLDDDMTFQQAIEKLGEYGAADVYNHHNEIYFKHWQAYTGGVKVNLTTSDLLSPPKVYSSIKDMINDYRIGYVDDAGTPAIDSDNNNIGNISRSDYGTQSLPEMDGSNNQQIEVQDLTSAVYIGETMIRRTHISLDTIPRSPQIISFSLSLSHEDWIDLQTFFSLTLSDEGWDEKIFEIYGVTINYNKNIINLVAYEVQT